MNDARLAKVLAGLALTVALIALFVAGYALSLEEARTTEMEALSERARRAMDAPSAPVRPPPVGLDDSE
jgi:hypothetical protein